MSELKNGWMTERMYEWMNEWMNKWMNERINWWMNKERMKMLWDGSTNDKTDGKMSEKVFEWTTKKKREH